MHGNLHEWSRDWDPLPPNVSAAWLLFGPAKYRVFSALHGGCFENMPKDCTSASEVSSLYSVFVPLHGFRVVAVPRGG